MWLPFYRTMSLSATSSPAEVLRQLSARTITSNGRLYKDKRVLVGNKRQFAATGRNFVYEARFSGATFRLIRIIGDEGGRTSNSFNPLCFGTVRERPAGSELQLTFRCVRFVLIFLSVYYAGVLFATLMLTLDCVERGRYQDLVPMSLVLSLFYLGFWFFHRFGFQREVTHTLEFLRGLGLSDPQPATPAPAGALRTPLP